jgi:hypothetical protein
MSCAAMSSLQPALLPLEAFEVLVLIAPAAEATSWHPCCHAIVTQFEAGAVERRPCLVFPTTELWRATILRDARKGALLQR